MVKRFFVYSLVLGLFVSCFGYKNEYGQKRFKHNRFTIKPNMNNEVYQLIDTTKIYEVISIEEINYKEELDIVNKSYLKFYGNGRLAEFYSYNEDEVASLNPKKAKMGLYNFTHEKLIIQFYFNHPQGGGLIKKELLKIEDGILTLINENYLYRYKIIPLPKEFLIYKPDW